MGGEIEHRRIIRPRQRKVSINGSRCARLAEFLGRFPVVALSSHDLQLVRGAPQSRRRALDLALSSLDEKYFTALRRYHAALYDALASALLVAALAREPQCARLSLGQLLALSTLDPAKRAALNQRELF